MSETTINESETTVTDAEETDQVRHSTERQSTDDGLVGWFAASTLRIGLAIVGFLLLLTALGQLSGLDLIGMAADAISTSIGRWLVVAVVAIALIVVAVRGFGNRGPT